MSGSPQYSTGSGRSPGYCAWCNIRGHAATAECYETYKAERDRPRTNEELAHHLEVTRDRLTSDDIKRIADRLRAAPQPSGIAQGSLPPLLDRGELVALLEDLASVNLSREAVERQARRMADDLIARGLTFATPQPADPAQAAPGREQIARVISEHTYATDTNEPDQWEKQSLLNQNVFLHCADAILALAPQPASTPANFVTIPTNLAQRLRDHLQQADSFVWLDEIQMLDAALPSTNGKTP